MNNCLQAGIWEEADPEVTIICKGKGSAVPLQAWSGQEGSRKLRFPDFMTTAYDGGKVVILTAPAAFAPRKYTWYSLLLEAESTPGP
jgi:hypothetical protein